MSDVDKGRVRHVCTVQLSAVSVDVHELAGWLQCRVQTTVMCKASEHAHSRETRMAGD